MRLAGRQGTELRLGVVGYQFPDDEVDPWESNALLVSVHVVAPQGTWEVTDPCLTTWEAARVRRWLAAVGRGADLTVGRAVALNEPNLSVVAWAQPAASDRVDLRFRFALETRPPWLRAAAGSHDLSVELDVARDDVGRAAADLAGELARFPQRGDDPTV